jgi:hypothetical protein
MGSASNHVIVGTPRVSIVVWRLATTAILVHFAKQSATVGARIESVPSCATNPAPIVRRSNATQDGNALTAKQAA